MTRRQKIERRLLWLIPILAAALAGIFLALCWWQNWLWFKPVVSPVQAGSPGAAQGEAAAMVQPEETANALESRMKLLLEQDGRMASWYQLAGKTGTPAAERANDFQAADQLLYGQYLLEQARETEFLAWWQTYRSAYGHDDDWRSNLSALRLLACSVTLWPGEERIAVLKQQSDSLLTKLAAGFPADYQAAVPTAKPTLDPAATPTPKPLATPTPDASDEVQLDVLRLASLDLYAMRQMAPLDERWQTHYDQALKLINQGYLNDDLPLYAWAYQTEQQGYLFYQNDTPAIRTEEALLTLLHLCEVGQAPQRSLSWLKDQLYNQRALYEYYHIVQGSPIGGQECLPAYAIAARIARITGDDDLYRQAVECLLRHQATSKTSAALSALFRQTEDERIWVWAHDNVWALLALR
ncbi:MAG: hypothetical protein VB070_05695 [Clostridiaceae bacterium]|nr:hypothetical protein [Clostridiaceae bacterium]